MGSERDEHPGAIADPITDPDADANLTADLTAVPTNLSGSHASFHSAAQDDEDPTVHRDVLSDLFKTTGAAANGSKDSLGLKHQSSFDRSSRCVQINSDITSLAQRITQASRGPSPDPEKQQTTTTLKSPKSYLSFTEFKRAFPGIPSILGSSHERPATFHEYLDQSRPVLNPFSPEFSPYAWAKVLMEAKKTDPLRFPTRSVGVAFENLGAFGYTKGTDFQRTVVNNVYRLGELVGRGKAKRKDILSGFNGAVQKGEMCVVLGRPGR